LSAAAGAAAGQATANAIGMTNKFDWKAVAMAGITAGVSKYVDGAYQADTYARMMAQLAATTMTQAVASAIGLQDSFSWKNVAAS
ncbi:hypothetical protein, partial [Parachitinimonas caeni]